MFQYISQNKFFPVKRARGITISPKTIAHNALLFGTPLTISPKPLEAPILVQWK